MWSCVVGADHFDTSLEVVSLVGDLVMSVQISCKSPPQLRCGPMMSVQISSLVAASVFVVDLWSFVNAAVSPSWVLIASAVGDLVMSVPISYSPPCAGSVWTSFFIAGHWSYISAAVSPSWVLIASTAGDLVMSVQISCRPPSVNLVWTYFSLHVANPTLVQQFLRLGS